MRKFKTNQIKSNQHVRSYGISAGLSHKSFPLLGTNYVDEHMVPKRSLNIPTQVMMSSISMTMINAKGSRLTRINLYRLTLKPGIDGRDKILSVFSDRQ